MGKRRQKELPSTLAVSRSRPEQSNRSFVSTITCCFKVPKTASIHRRLGGQVPPEQVESSPLNNIIIVCSLLKNYSNNVIQDEDLKIESPRCKVGKRFKKRMRWLRRILLRKRSAKYAPKEDVEESVSKDTDADHSNSTHPPLSPEVS